MATITIKNIPDDLYQELKLRAERNHRSVNSEVIFLIEQAVRKTRVRSVEDVIARARVLRDAAPNVYVTDEALEAAINEGRD